MTTAADQPGPAAGPVRVLANTAVLARLPASTRTAVFGHEAFHVATWGRAAVPRWLSEGLADYAGYHESGADLGSAVAGALRQVRADGAPAALPEDAAFDDPLRATMAYEAPISPFGCWLPSTAQPTWSRCIARSVPTGQLGSTLWWARFSAPTWRRSPSMAGGVELSCCRLTGPVGREW